jgi:tetratricopeptide (TPR) repeat protein
MPRALHGRTAELAAIVRGIQTASAGRAQAFAIVGEPGIGKTRLTIEAAARATDAGFVACWGRAWEAGGAPPYWPWRLLFESIADVDRGGALAQLWGHGHGASADPDQARFALFDAVAEALRRASAAAPLLCVLDDLHAADVPSLELAAFATRGLRSSRVVWLMTWRDAEAERAPVRDLIARVAREATIVSLPRLSTPEASALIDEVRSETPAAVRDALLHATGGNPLFLLETLACLHARGLGDVTRLPLAQGVGAIVRERLEPLAPAVRRLLEAAAVVGRDVTLSRWAAAADAPTDLVRQRAAAMRGILDEIAEDRWRFSHELVRDAIARETPRELVVAAHRRLALALDGEIRAGDAAAIGERAHHGLLADLDSTTALDWAIAAAEHARAQCAYEEALAVLARAADAIGTPARASAAYLLALGRAHAVVGDARAARDTLHAAIALARAADDPEMVARAVLALGERYVLGDIQGELVAEIDRAAAALPETARDLHARLLARKAAALMPSAHPTEILEMARDAVALVAESIDPAARLDVAVGAGSAFADFVHPRERIPVNEDLVRFARACGDRALELRGVSRLVTDHLEAGDFARADVLLVERDDLARALVLPRFAWQAPLFRSMRAMARGDWAICDAAIAEADAIARELDDLNVTRAIALHRFELALAADRAGELTALEPSLLSATRTMPSWRTAMLRSVLSFRRGDLDDARIGLAMVHAEEAVHGATKWAALLAEPLAAAGTAEQQQRAYDRLAPHADTFAVWGLFALTCGPPIAASLGVLAAALGDRARAEEHFAAALAMTRANDAPALARRTERWRERALGASVAEKPARVAAAFALRPHAGAWLVESPRGSSLVPDVRGMGMLAQLLARPDVEIHALELVSGSGEHADGGDAGPVLDAKAIAVYRKRAAELAEIVERAEARGDARAAESAQDELEALQRELARGVGLGRRTRRSGAATERARVTAQRRVREAIKRIGDVDGELAAELDRAIKTGTYCVYNPRR